jgi:hypothetical protein
MLLRPHPARSARFTLPFAVCLALLAAAMPVRSYDRTDAAPATSPSSPEPGSLTTTTTTTTLASIRGN